MSDTTLTFQGSIVQTVSIKVIGTCDTTAFGAQGSLGAGGVGGLGAEIGGDFVLTAG